MSQTSIRTEKDLILAYTGSSDGDGANMTAIGSLSKVRGPRTGQLEVECFSFWRGFAPYRGQEKVLLMTVA